ncbi:MAG: hypothetical protein OHK0015_25090 [Chloroflexi bacterium OHK40]
MTPTLYGRWQTRLVLLGTFGLAITLGLMWHFGVVWAGFQTPGFWELPLLLGYVVLLGLAWDGIYQAIQRHRWDGDWPLVFGFAAGVVEGGTVFALFRLGWLPGTRFDDGDAWRFLAHYGLVFLVTYWWQIGPMRVISLRWRFHGGELT